MANEYDITEAFAAIERELINSMFRNIKSHKAEEIKEDKQWAQWQIEQLKALEEYKVQNQKKYTKKFRSINNAMEEMIRLCNEYGGLDQEKEIAEAIKNGFKGFKKASKSMQGEFFKLNERKLDALIKATMKDAEKAERAILRMANDKYRSIIFNAQVYANTGAGTYEQAIDMASKDFLSAGLNCVEYKNGARHKLSDYISMALRTANKRAYLYGEGEKRQEWGISTVIMNKRGNPCPLCLPWVGKILIDDVWSGGSAKDGPYPLLSTAMAAGLYHPNCRDSHTTYFEGISTPPDDKFTKQELEEIEANYQKMQKRQYAKRQAEKNERLAENSLDEENKRQYKKRADVWKNARFKTGDVDTEEYIEKQRLNSYFSKPLDITEEWKKVQGFEKNNPTDLLEYTVEGSTYVVDGRYVILDYTQHEKNIADIIAKSYGKKVEMVPRVVYPQGVQTPDYLIDGKGYDLKTPEGNGKNTIYDAVKSKKKQANNFIICVDKTELTVPEVEEQVKGIYTSNRTRFVDTILLVKDGSVVKAFKRKK